MIQSFLVDGGERFIFEEQVPGEAPEDSRLLLDCKLSPVKRKRETERKREREKKREREREREREKAAFQHY